MSIERIQYLISRYLDALITEEELGELTGLLKDNASTEGLRQALAAHIGREQVPYKEEDWEPLFEKVMARTIDTPAETRRGLLAAFSRNRWMAAAVSLFLVVGIGWLLQRGSVHHGDVPVGVAMLHDAAPGSSKAVLTLADGKKIQLDAAHNGLVGRQGGEELVSRNAQLVYRVTDNGAARTTDSGGYNVLTTPRGGQYSLVLPDGTKAWLNADTYLRYPTRFTGGRREVELRGEAYFEVADNAHAPFRVNVLRGQGEAASDPLRVDVLGTHFNIMDYDDEPVIRTTLLEGAVRVRKGVEEALLKPGQQARLEDGVRLVVATADVSEAVAWKNGMFKFNGAGIGQVMRQLSRWYDLDVEYVNGVPKDFFQGEMYRDVKVSELLKVLEASGVHFTVQGRKLLVK